MNLSKISNKYTQIAGLTNYLLVLALAFSASFPNRIFNSMWVLWLISWLLEGRFLKKSNFSFNKSKIPVLLLLVFYIWEAISLFWAKDKAAGLSMLEKQMSFVAIVPIALFGVNRYYKTTTILLSVVIGVLVSILSYSMTLLYAYNYEYLISSGDLSLWNGFDTKTFTVWLTNIKHRLYYNTVLVIAIFSLPFLYKKHATKQGKYLTLILTLITAITILAMLYLTESRSIIVALLLIVAIVISRMINKKHRVYVVSGVVLLISIGSYLFVEYHPRMQNFKANDFETLKTGKTTNEFIEPRLLIWHAVFENPQDYLLHGLGVGNSTDYLVEKYLSNGFPEVFATRKYSAHNQYFIATMELGLAGGLFLILFFFLFHRFLRGNARRFGFYFSLLMSFNLLTEGMLGRGDGVLTLCFFALVCIWMQQEQNPNEDKMDFL